MLLLLSLPARERRIHQALRRLLNLRPRRILPGLSRLVLLTEYESVKQTLIVRPLDPTAPQGCFVSALNAKRMRIWRGLLLRASLLRSGESIHRGAAANPASPSLRLSNLATLVEVAPRGMSCKCVCPKLVLPPDSLIPLSSPFVCSNHCIFKADRKYSEHSPPLP
jgi:hypothetical protein